MKVFISGASGLVGSNCLHYFKEQGLEAVGSHLSFPTKDTVYFDALNQADPKSFDLIKFKPDVIIHCGALTNVDYCEDHQEESFEKTVKSTEYLIETARKCGSKFVYISTDYVFDGNNGPYIEASPTNPINIYGMHKLMTEREVLKYNMSSLIIRITNVYGDEERGKNFVARIVNQCKTNTALKLDLPFDQYATPTNAHDIARALYLLIKDDKFGTYHIGGTDFMNRVSLAHKVLRYFPNAQYQLNALSTLEINQKAQRPLFGGLIPFRFLEEYPDFLFSNLDDYLRAQMG